MPLDVAHADDRPQLPYRASVRLPPEAPVDLDDGAPARCHVRLAAEHTGVATLLTGLAMLAQRGRAQLTWECVPPPPPLETGPWHLRDKAATNAELVVDGRHSVFVDIHDSFEIDEAALAAHDIYFKRSLQPGALSAMERRKVRALGLVNHLHPDGVDRQQFRRVLARPMPFAGRAAALLRLATTMAASMLGLGGRPTLSLMTGAPTRTREPQVLFMAGLWDPAQVPDIAPEKIAEFEAINEMRAECVRVLRREFGSRFHGGVQHSEFARRRFPDVLLGRGADGGKRAFLGRVRRSPICVTTTGLHGSNGWKLVEYLSLSRAIVSEPLRYAVAGDFAAGRNYLAFTTPAECGERVARLMERHDEREAMMEANQRYADEWMRPDRLAWRVIRAARGAV
jgi:hypothetical protein